MVTEAIWGNNMDIGRARFLTVNELAEMLAISPLTVRRMAASEALPAFRVGRVLRFAPADIDAYLARNRSGGEKDAYLKPGGLKGSKQSVESATARRNGGGSGTAKRQAGRAKGSAKVQGKGRGGRVGRPARSLRPAGNGQ